MRIVLVADDHILRDGLRALFGGNEVTEVIGEANGASDAMKVVSELQPDVLLADIGSWTGGNIDLIRQISASHPDIRIVALSAFRNQAFVAEAFRAGVHGYVVKRNGFDQLLRAIEAVCDGSTYLCPRVRELILPECTHPHRAPGMPSDVYLSERQCAVLQLLAEGRTSKEIGLRLNISSKTIDASRRHLMKKLEVDSLAGLIKQALAMGMTTLVS